MDGVVAVILAAGQGTRMRSAVPKPLHPLCGQPLVVWPVRAALDAGMGVVVVEGENRAVEPALPAGARVAIQADPRGTGHAVLCAEEAVTSLLTGEAPGDALVAGGTVLVLAGDVPLVTSEALAAIARAHDESDAAATMVTMVLEDAGEYGRVVRADDGSVERVVEAKDPSAVPPEVLAIREVNTGILAFDAVPLFDALREVRPDAVQKEIFLPEALTVLRGRGHKVAAHVVDDPDLTLGVNDRADLALVREKAQARILERHMLAGVTVVDPASTAIDVDVEIGRDTTIEPFTFLHGATRIGDGCAVGPCTTLIDTTLGARVTVKHSYATGAEVHDDVSIGPFAYLRPDARLREGSKIGTFVEVKNSDVGPGAKVPHLSYLGDADVGERTNLGAGTITANYDGRRKHRTTIGARVKGGVDTAFVAPVTVGDDAYTAAGSVITEDVPAGALGVARARQRNVLDYARRVEEAARAEEAGAAGEAAPPRPEGGADAPSGSRPAVGRGA